MATVYVASPLGFSPATRGFYEVEILGALREAALVPLDPWSDPLTEAELSAAMDLPRGERRHAALQALNRRVGAANAASIEAADALLAVLDGVDVDSGTAAEVGFAAGLGKPVVGLRLDTRQSGDNEGALVNLQVEHFIRAGGGDVHASVAAAVAMLSELVSAPLLASRA